ncbi:hypothetical protein RND81_08G186700 [Saponaria officinalis]
MKGKVKEGKGRRNGMWLCDTPNLRRADPT